MVRFLVAFLRFGVVRQTALFAEKEMDYEAELVKIEKEADDRMDAKVAELMSKIATTGSN